MEVDFGTLRMYMVYKNYIYQGIIKILLPNKFEKYFLGGEVNYI